MGRTLTKKGSGNTSLVLQLSFEKDLGFCEVKATKFVNGGAITQAHLFWWSFALYNFCLNIQCNNSYYTDIYIKRISTLPYTHSFV